MTIMKLYLKCFIVLVQDIGNKNKNLIFTENWNVLTRKPLIICNIKIEFV